MNESARLRAEAMNKSVRQGAEQGFVLDAVEQHAERAQRSEAETEIAGESFEAHVSHLRMKVDWFNCTTW
jgi:hypothetical protein